MPNTLILIFPVFLAVQRGESVNSYSIPYTRFPLRFKLCTLANNCSPSIAPDRRDRKLLFKNVLDRPQDKFRRLNCAIKAQFVSVLDWVLHIYYNRFKRKSPICFYDRFLIFPAVKYQGLDIDVLFSRVALRHNFIS